MNELEQVRRFLKVISRAYSFEIISFTHSRPRTAPEISDFLKTPYTTVKTRLNELIEIGALDVSSEKQPNLTKHKIVYKSKDFFLELDPRRISELCLHKNQ